MSEKDKMISGKAYKGFDNELFLERQKAKSTVFKFNSLNPSEIKSRNRIITNLLGRIGESFFIEPPFRCDYGYNIEIVSNFYSNYNLVILDGAKVSIGNNVMIGPNVGLYTAGHPIHHEIRNQDYEYAFPIVIEDNVWIGGSVCINPGVTIGSNTVIASGSVVIKDIPSNVIAAGNPCKVLRTIDDNDKLYCSKREKIE